MSSVGRQLCHTLVDAAGDLRRYAHLMDEWDTRILVLNVDIRQAADALEALVVPILRFEGEQPRELARGAS